jgi:Bacterial Ig domain
VFEGQFCCGQGFSSPPRAGWYSALLLALPAALAALALAPAALAGPDLHVGVVEDSAVWGDPDLETARVEQAGFDTIRVTAQWTSGHTELEHSVVVRLQRAVLAAQARGIRVVVAVYNTGSSETPADPILQSEFVQFARNTAASLPLVSTFVVGNEPNSNYYWQPQFDTRGGDSAAAQYEGLLAQSYDAIKSVRPDATVAGGALDSAGTDDPAAARPAHSPLTFIRDMGVAYRASHRARPIMDVFDEHVYQDNSSLPPSMPHPSSPAIGEADYQRLVGALGQAFDGTAQAGSSLPIVYGEFGVESVIPPAESGAYTGTESPTAKPVDEATQAAYYIQAIKLALCQPTVTGIYLFHLEDEADLSRWQSGVYYADGNPKSSLGPVRDAAGAARAGTLAACPDRSAPTVSVAPPANGTITAQASDDVGVGKVVLLVNGVPVGVRYTAPYTFALPRSSGRATYQVKAYDAAGNVGSATVTLRAAARAARRR